MKLTKKLEVEILKVYNTVWDAYLRGDMRTFASTLDENCYIIGSAAGEVFKNKKAAVKYYKSTAEQITGKAEFRNRKIKVMPVEKGFMVNEKADFYLLIDDQWTFYGHGRISSLFHKKNNKWKVVHQHGSFPDSKTEEGEQVNTDKIKAENIQLRDAVKRRTEELENKNRELEIEAALERVRARAMAMQSSDELIEVANVMRQQMVELGQSGFDTAAVHLYSDDSEYFDSWYSFRQGDPVTGKIVTGKTKFKKDACKMLREMVKAYHSKESDYTIKGSGEKLREWFSFLAKTIPEIKINLDKNPGSNYIHFSDFSGGSLVMATYEPPTKDSMLLQKRCAAVFDLAYRRYIDLKKAEAQARETGIELSLERVRAKAMAMQKPSEFVDVINIIGEQLIHLGFDIDWANFGANGFDISEGIDIWNFGVVPGASPISARVFFPYFDHPVFTTAAENVNEFLNGGRDLITVTLDKQAKDTWLDHMFTNTIFKDIPEEYRVIQYGKPGYTTSNISLKDTWLSIGKFDIKNFTDEQHAIFRRFANAFGQAYTRFLDLQKAEAQAREAQIEASLERVRSRAMAMQNSDELKELIGTVFTELTKLDIVLTRCLIMIYDPKSNDSVWWMANSEAPTQPIGLKVQYHEYPSYLAYVNAWKQKELKWTYTLEGNTKKEWDDFLFVETELSHLPDFVIAGMKTPDRVYLNASFNSFGNLTLATLEPLTNEHFDIMLRFAKVFDLTYTRFNDLKQAEAQAREARIETSLERIRARTMAMQKSDELPETTFLLFQQLKDLGETAAQLSIGIIKEEKGYVELSATVHGNKMLQTYHVPADEPFVMNKVVKAWKEKERSLTVQIEGQELKDYNNWRNSVLETKINFPENKWIVNIVFFSKGMLSFSSDTQIRKETLQLLERFAGVFDLTYTRFLDLKKAEAQTREAQIELALERVRARTMAMHKSEELAETSQVLFHQLSELGGIPDRISIAITDEVNGVANFWSTDQQGSHLDHSFSARLNERTTIAKTYQAWKEQKKSLVIDLHGEELNEWILFAREEMGIAVKDDQIKDRRVHTVAFFSHGWILVTSHEPQSTETIQILERFASVFNLTYRRFLDLQKAEAQAHEARIEIALERIRARALAMHKSDELMEVANVLREQMALLGQPELESSVVHLYEVDPDHILSWRSFRALDPHSRIAYGHMAIPKSCCEVVREWLTKFYSDLKEYTIEISGAKQEEWYEILFKLAPDVINSMRQENSIHEKRYYRFSKFSGGALLMVSKQEPSEEVTYLQRRAAVVFDLAYRRFADLQKAEAQAKESQIETALEKVRASAMAMHNSNDISSTTTIIFVELKKLSIQSIRCGIGLLSKKSPAAQVYAATTSPDSELATLRRSISMTDHPALQQQYESWLKQENYIQELKQDELRSYYQLPFFHSSANYIPPENFEQSELGYYIPFSEGVFYAWTKKAYSDDEINILNRFKTIVDLTFRRYLDLQKAEAQAREAQIEAALERVRSKTMAMHNSQDVGETVAVMFDELRKLDVETLRCGVGIMLENYQMELWTARPGATGKVEFIVGNIDMKLHPLLTGGYEAWKNRAEGFFYELKDEDLKTYFDAINSHQAYPAKYDISSLPSLIFHYEFNFNEGCLFAFSTKKFSDESSQIFKRFASVFGQTYRRYLDLQKAEAQAREAQIETSLERIRSRTMGMQKSNELGDVAALLSKELLSLGITQFASCGYVEIEEKNNRQRSWLTNPDGTSLEAFYLPLTGEHIFNERYDAWKRKDVVFKQVVHAKELKKHLDFSYSGFGSQESENVGRNFFPDPTIFYNCNFSYGYLSLITGVMLTQAEELLLARFTRVFEQTYSRFLDLQKAEAQAREAQIEASLERVRSKTMAMHNSQDVGDTVATMLDELVKLGVETVRCGIAIIDESKTMEVWTASTKEDGSVRLIIGQLDMKTHPLFMGVYDAWKNKVPVTTYELTGEDLKDYFRAINNSPNYPTRYDIDSLPHRQSNAAFMFPEGSLFVFSQEPLVTETTQIFKRFAGVFGQTYRRYLDLQKAEAQAREALIEAGLERVRARTMAMHSSDDVSIATATMFTELEKLGIENFRGGITNIHPNRTQEVWSVNNLAEGKSVKAVGIFNMDAHPFWQQMYEEWVNKKDFVYTFLTGKEKEDYIKILNATQGYLSQTIQEFPDVHFQVYAFNEGGVWTNSLKPHTEEEKQIMKRFASVFSLTFRRYQDLQKAEAQTREAIIETALEKVRGKAMAMHNSNDLTATASLVFTELRKLGINPMRCGVGMLNKENRKGLLYTAIASEEGDNLSQIGWVLLDVHPVLRSVYDHWIRGEDYFPVLKEEVLRSFYEQLKSGFAVPEEQTKYEHHGYFLPFSEGVFYGWSEKPFTELEIKVLKRFASVIDLTFRRYIELQKSEGNAREAVKQAALDRVRAEIASMRTINDLDRITPLIWNELTILGIPFIRCGVFIMDDEQELIHTFLSTPDGKAIAAFHLPYDTPGKLRHVVANWKKNRKYIDHWDETEFIQFADILVKGGALISSELYLKTIPKGGFYLHFLPFLQGMLYVGNTTQLKQEEIELIQHVADAFSTAYARYEDFNKLESAKQQVEKTLTDLKQAQTQLVQSEKMASLGEMTAGIAHEIQNPLNFVNNFSEVSKELLDEMKTELETGNTEDAKDIADDVIQNLEKINHHGKRADAIVKSMLQHSRSSSGKKEPADINGLADEYLRLAYHGLRAKDKSFNAKFETEFDNNIGKVNIISQDIGRVLVNLINNAFYAVSERKKQESNGYEPTVTVYTKKIDDKVEIKVRDNGNGIPQKVLDKIFQPFFTTKPTGQGTGLGLSLAYDIVTKGHGGELKVETKEGEGSEFIIQLPNQSS